MSSQEHNILVNVPQVVELYGVSEAAVRRWVFEGILKPVRREGKGRGGEMFFAKGEVSALVYGLCPVCGNGFKREKLSQRFCSTYCRQRSSRLQAGGGRNA